MISEKYIYLDKKSKVNPYRVKIYKLGKTYHVGRYKELEDAIRSRDRFLEKLENFPQDQLDEKSIPW
jgi:type IV secretory pathway TrbF-like protein